MDKYDHQLEEIRQRSVEIGVDLSNLRSGDLGALEPLRTDLIAELETEAMELAQRRMMLVQRLAQLQQADQEITAAERRGKGRRSRERRAEGCGRLAVRSSVLAAILLVIATAWQSPWVAGVAAVALVVAGVAWRRSLAAVRRLPAPIIRGSVYAEREAAIADLEELASDPSNPQSSNGNGSNTGISR